MEIATTKFPAVHGIELAALHPHGQYSELEQQVRGDLNRPRKLIPSLKHCLLWKLLSKAITLFVELVD